MPTRGPRTIAPGAWPSRTQVSKKGGQAGSYDDWTVAQLRKRAAELEISGRSSMKRSQLIRALRNN